MKPRTHTGKVEHTNRAPRWVLLRETPKFWTDGNTRWRKQRTGTTKSTWKRNLLDLASVRPLTVAEQREPLERAVDSAVLWRDKQLESLRVAKKQLAKTRARIKDLTECCKMSNEYIAGADAALAKFDKQHNLE